jgi:hypothetical protein
VLIESKEKQLQLFGHVIGLDKTNIPRRSLELKFKGRKHGMTQKKMV